MARQETYQGLARKYRPQTFEDLVGQEAVARGIEGALRQGRVAHGHLMAGPRGTGKTTSARLLARALNCVAGPTAQPCGTCRHCVDIAAGSDLDVIEIDAASNTGVDNIRELRERVIQAPFAARYKLYIIDEVHMLSSGAFNALLKTLEEPPPSVVFVLATTELERVPETIRSRCVIHGFRRLSSEDIIRRLGQVCEREGVELEPAMAREVFGMIARSAEGGMRDALVALDSLLSMTEGKPDAESAARLLGMADQGSLRQAVEWIRTGDGPRLLGLVEELVERGRNLERFARSLSAYLRELMLIQAGAGERLLPSTGEALESARRQARELAPATLFNMLNQLLELEERMKRSAQARFLLEFTLLRLATVQPVVPIEEIMARIGALPEAAFGPAAPAAAPDPPRERPAQRTAPAPAAAFVMHDSAAPAAAESPVPPLAAVREPGGTDVKGELLPQLPEFLGRYLAEARQVVLEGDALRVDLTGAIPLARRILNVPDNVRLLEGTLANHFGKPVRLVLLDEPVGGAMPKAVAPAAPAAAARVLKDGRPEGRVQDEDDEPEPPPPSMSSRPAAPAAAPKVKPATASVDSRGAVERARAFLGSDPEVGRRVKLLREIFSGRLIDEDGQAIQV